ncbi:MAG: PQQ-binding-like beta-propeller repeat protein [bacterium]|nr:PQQ-binding-like beta-propeller repeat protein [bacterium]
MTDKIRSPFSVLAAALVALVLIAPAAISGDWSQWRGPNQDGTLVDQGAFGDAAFGLDVEWVRELGIAYSAIAVVGDRAITMYGDGEVDWLIAMDAATGEEIWNYRIDSFFEKIGGSDGGPLSMPVVHDGTVYGLGARGHLFAVNFDDGEELWSFRIDEKLGARMPRFGFTTSPLIVDDMLFVQTGAPDGRSLVAFNRKTGDEIWSVGDDRVGYQSPVIAEIAGKRQIIAVTNVNVLGLDPSNGEVLWSQEYGADDQDGSANPVLLGDDSFVLMGRNDTSAYRVTEDGDAFGIETLWTSSSLKGSFATPVLHDGHLYGFDGNFLSCVNPKDGERVWKSRPPGGRGLIAVDGHLIVFTNDGDVVVAPASPEGFAEKARVNVSEYGTYTYPTFARNAIFVRNIKDIARVEIGAAAKIVAEVEVEPRNEFETFLARVENSEHKSFLLDDFMAWQERFPIVENDRWVHFVYRGDADDVAISGSMTEYQVEEPMAHVEGTDLFYKSYEIEPGSRWEYSFNVDFENVQPDPLNPRRAPAEGGAVSEVVVVGFEQAAYLRPYEGKQGGRIETFTFESEILENERQIDVYLPPGYDSGRQAYPLLVVADGKSWTDMANLPNTLDHLINKSMAPVVVAFVERPPQTRRAEFGGDKTADHTRMLAEELVPRLEEKYRTIREASGRAIMGAGSGALVATHAAVTQPGVFGKVGVYSVYLPEPLATTMMEAVEGLKPKKAGEFAIRWNRYELRRQEWGIDLEQHSARLTEALEKRGIRFTAAEMPNGYGWGAWRQQAGGMLEEFFPQ